jgi:hypothetical protein
VGHLEAERALHEGAGAGRPAAEKSTKLMMCSFT